MSTTLNSSSEIPWWKEPTKDQWKAYIAAWLGWTLDAFDFTIFLLIMVPIAKEFDVPLTAVTAVFTITLWLRLVGATAAGWMADRMGRKAPLMISILWYSLCNFIAGFSPTFAFLFFFRALLGIGMGAEWPAGAALAMESWPARSRGFMSGILQGSWGLGFALSALAYGFLFDLIGWRGLLWIGILPAFVVIWIRFYVKEPEVWVENKRLQRESKAEVQGAPVLHLQARPAVQHADGLPVDGQRLLRLLLDLGAVLDLPAEGAELDAADGGDAAVLGQHRRLCRQRPVGPRGGQMGKAAGDHRAGDLSPSSSRRSICGRTDPLWIIVGFIIQGIFGGSIYGQNPSYLSERFPTEVRATASGFVYHQGAIWGGLVAPVLTYLAVQMNMGFAMPMMISTIFFLVIVIIAVLLGPRPRASI